MVIALMVVLFCFAAYGVIARTAFISKAEALYKSSRDPMWKIWYISAIEPVVTTIVWTVYFFVFAFYLQPYFFDSQFSFLIGTHITVQLCLLLFIISVLLFGKGIRRARLVMTLYVIRFVILSIPYFSTLFELESPFIFDDLLTTLSGVSLLAAFLVRALFGIYQERVTPTLTEYERNITEGQINLGREIEDGITLTDDIYLWNAQVALIEQLKAEQVTEWQSRVQA